MAKQDKYTKSSRGEQCQVRVPGVCNFDESTTVPAHLGGAGMGTKHSNIHLSYCCSSCHDAIDGRTKTDYTRDELKLMHLEGIIRTQILMIEKGLLKL